MTWNDKNQRKAEERHREYRWCPYPHCTFGGNEEEVDDHRSSTHTDEAQQGSNLKHRPRG